MIVAGIKSKNQEDLENNVSKVAVELASQLPISGKDKIRSWRYLSMLGNPKTHIKNLGANVAMNLTQRVKNTVAGAIEGVASVFNPEMERTKTLRKATSEQKEFAKQDEGLLGYLYLSGQTDRLNEILEMSIGESNED